MDSAEIALFSSLETQYWYICDKMKIFGSYFIKQVLSLCIYNSSTTWYCPIVAHGDVETPGAAAI